jgi:hypothetical protein
MRRSPPRSRVELEPAVFRADHPFVSLIRDDRTDTILILGRIVGLETAEPLSSEVPPHAAAVLDVLLAIMRPEIVLFAQHLPVDEPARPAQVEE